MNSIILRPSAIETDIDYATDTIKFRLDLGYYKVYFALDGTTREPKEWQ